MPSLWISNWSSPTSSSTTLKSRQRVRACRGIRRQGIHARGDGEVTMRSDMARLVDDALAVVENHRLDPRLGFVSAEIDWVGISSVAVRVRLRNDEHRKYENPL